ncbi:MAG: hypothetical protein A2087_08120 [Spirochaetes bacterium GWD1_61_31]|nr:MAG: hypothetical protein A2Y37_03915 [Spirochaetes bacterium GWB1_60_80]OHD28837.1 MAG: hypothetical protein A2004_08375 [Spirochaetes bacterium GWC1_61_12]OHD42144.1 MAG: hypothetical protein A2087_08120 [Spirochaetes bacterium GWD1_61_31]OHD45435.1 MAG: hypothetical protein A2Y35_06415 [Spirochaetes bacterium GWE1_60_18]OHD61523.1 MAG: hypothetical protein A2Y32_09415 [Spirochaetes bacterium GWF1_60_12]HAP43251.1 hypothetical protein [Spirochaetaceae bacterium]
MSIGNDQRGSTRLASFARVLFTGSGLLGYLADASRNGFRVRSAGAYDGAVPGTELVTINFAEIGVLLPALRVTVCWSRREDNSSLFGCMIDGFDSDRVAADWQKILATYTQGDGNDTCIECSSGES